MADITDGDGEGSRSAWANDDNDRTAIATTSTSTPAASTTAATAADDLNNDNIWASAPSLGPPPSSTADVHASTRGVEDNDPDPAAVLRAVAHPLPAHMLADLDPYAPSATSSTANNATTLGSTVASGSLLELLPSDDEDERPSVDREEGAPSQSNAAPPQAKRDHAPTGLGLSSPSSSGRRAASGTGNSFLGGMFRSISGQGAGNATAASGSNTGSGSNPVQSSSSPLSKAAEAGTHDDEKQEHSIPQQQRSGPPSAFASTVRSSSAGLSIATKPLASIANVFKSATSSSNPNSRPSTPEKQSHSQLSEKSPSTAATGPATRRAGKEKMKEDDREALFDFNKFLEQMRSRSADPVAKYLRSFLKEFSRRPPISTTDQIRVINDFLDFIAGKMRQVDPWRALFVPPPSSSSGAGTEWDVERAEAEFDMAMEAMEKLVMNRLWHLTFTPALDLSSLPGQVSPTGDVERDQILTQRIKLFAWIKPSHLDLPIPDPPEESDAERGQAQGKNGDDGEPMGTPRIEQLVREAEEARTPESEKEEGEQQGEKENAKTEGVEAKTTSSAARDKSKNKDKDKDRHHSSHASRDEQRQVRGFLDFARRELLKINNYKAPRDKMICVLNCCKVIFGLIRHVSSEEGADAFIPFLIYVVLKANPEHLVSNLQYIQRFRNPEKLSGEGGYYLSSLTGAISFIETVDAAALSNITQAEFHENVAKAIRELPLEPNESPRLTNKPNFASGPAIAPPVVPQKTRPTSPATTNSLQPPQPPRSPGPGAEVAASALSDGSTDSPSLIQLQQSPVPATVSSFPATTKQFLLRSTDSVERIVSKPLGAISRIFDQLEQSVSELPGGQQVMHGYSPGPPPGSPNGRRALPALPLPLPGQGGNGQQQQQHNYHPQYQQPSPTSPKRRMMQPFVGGAPPQRLLQQQQQQQQPEQQHQQSSEQAGMYAPEGISPEQAAVEMERQQEEARLASIETLRSVFPSVEDEVLEMVLLSNSGDMARTIDSLLEMS